MQSKRKPMSWLGLVLAALVSMLGPTAVSATPAHADGTGTELCVDKKAYTETIQHDAVTHNEWRWKQEVPEVAEVKNYQFRAWQPPVYVSERQFVRTNSGQEETFHNEYQFVRTNPGQEETFTTQYKYAKVIPGTDGVKECQYKKWVSDTETQYRYVYQKKVAGDVYKKKSYGQNQKVGTFDWEWWQPPTWNGGPLTHWGDWGYVADTEDSGPHSSTSNTYQVDGSTFFKQSTQYKYFRTDKSESRQVETGGHWEYQYFTENPGGDWTKTGDCRWKVDPVPDQTVPYNDGNWTDEILGAPWFETDRRQHGNNDAIAPFDEYKTVDGVTTDPAKADWFTQASFEGWTQFGDARERLVAEGYWIYKTLEGFSLDIADAAWFVEAAFENWEQFASKVVVEHVAAYWVYYVSGGEPTLELGESNWTTDWLEDKGWTFVDERIVTDKDAWTERIEHPATYKPCELAYTGLNDLGLWVLGLGGLLFVVAGLPVAIAAHRKNSRTVKPV